MEHVVCPTLERQAPVFKWHIAYFHGPNQTL